MTEASALWQARRFDEALNKYEHAVRRDPRDFATLIEASRAFGKRYQIEQSLELLRRAEELGQGRPEIHHAIGESYAMLRRTQQAEDHFRLAIGLDRHPRSMFELARLCERRHALTEAADLLAEVLCADAGFLAANILRCRVQRRTGALEEARTTLTQLVQTSPAGMPGLSEILGELGTLLDSIGEYDQAWQAMLQSKAILRRGEAGAWNAGQFVTKRFAQMFDEITPQHFMAWKSDLSREPTSNLAILTGFPRSGTTLLEQVLDSHPLVTAVEEVEAFSDVTLIPLGRNDPPETPILTVLQKQELETICNARSRYLRAMESIAGRTLNGQLLIDKNPALNLLIPAFRRVFPETKLIVVLRDPRDVVLSCFMQQFPVNPVSVWFLTLERAVERYLTDLQAWLKLRTMTDDWIEVRYEDLVTNLESQAARTLAALGLPWTEEVLNYRTRTDSRPVNSPTYDAVNKAIYRTSIGRWQNYSEYLRPVLDRLDPMVKALGYEL